MRNFPSYHDYSLLQTLEHLILDVFLLLLRFTFVLQLLSAVANDLDYMLTDLYDSPPTTLNR